VSLASCEGNSRTDERLSQVEGQLKEIALIVKGLIDPENPLPTVAQPETLPKPKVASYIQRPAKSSPMVVHNNDKRKDPKPKPNRTTVAKIQPVPPKTVLSVICTNVPEATDTLLANKQEHDMKHWFQLCSRMGLRAIKPVSLIRLSRKPNSPHDDKPRLIKVVVQSEKELEDILLSAYLLRDDNQSSSRVFADVPWLERTKPSLPGQQQNVQKHDGRSVIILNVPEPTPDSDKNAKTSHDLNQWKYLSNTIQTNDEAVVDIFRIPKSPRYEGNGPRPLKIRLLTASMVASVLSNWKRYRHKLPRDIRFVSGIPKQHPDTVVESMPEPKNDTPIETPTVSKNDSLPAPQ
jgi:hypothetical protein